MTPVIRDFRQKTGCDWLLAFRKTSLASERRPDRRGVGLGAGRTLGRLLQ